MKFALCKNVFTFKQKQVESGYGSESIDHLAAFDLFTTLCDT